VLTPHGTVVFVGGEDGDRWTGGMDRQLRGFVTSLARLQKARTLLATMNKKDLRILAERPGAHLRVNLRDGDPGMGDPGVHLEQFVPEGEGLR
jgi:hypothetical protein